MQNTYCDLKRLRDIMCIDMLTYILYIMYVYEYRV